MKANIPMILLAAALSAPLTAQTLTEQLQKGIYAEETLGDRDEAARIYRQIVAAPAVPRSTHPRSAAPCARRGWTSRS